MAELADYDSRNFKVELFDIDETGTMTRAKDKFYYVKGSNSDILKDTKLFDVECAGGDEFYIVPNKYERSILNVHNSSFNHQLSYKESSKEVSA